MADQNPNGNVDNHPDHDGADIRDPAYHFIPGYYYWVKDECPDYGYAYNLLRRNNNTLRKLCHTALYGKEIRNPNETARTMYHRTIERFLRKCFVSLSKPQYQHMFHDIPHDKMKSVLTFFYNRQLIVQVFGHPKPTVGGDVSIPLRHYPANELQVDIMYLMESSSTSSGLKKGGFQNRNGSRTLLVIVDPYSRYMWAIPVSDLKAKTVSSAFHRLFNPTSKTAQSYNNDFGKTYYEFLRDHVERIVTDGGSEFQADFKQSVHQSFPHAKVLTARSKNQTMGRPTSTGSVEAAIGTLRRVIRDQELLDPQTMGTLMETYSNMEQPHSLKNFTPKQMAWSVMNHEKQILQIQDDFTNKRIENAQIRRGQKMELFSDPNKIVYRIYVPPEAFAKAVDLRVEWPVYLPYNYNATNNSVSLQEFNLETGKRTHRIKKNISTRSLVAFKFPIDNGSLQLLKNLETIARYNKFTVPKDTTMEYEITNAVERAIG